TFIAEFGEERRIPVRREEVPEQLINAILTAEDDAFFSHSGVDLMGVVRAVIANVRSRVHGQGASTITMQVARNYFLTPEKTYIRKLKEVLLALRIERALSKDQILELYLNKIFLGHRAYGFAAAAQVYYGMPFAELTLPEIAMLAALPKAPSKNNPLTNPDNARARRDYVLRRMRRLDYISDQELADALSAPLTAKKYETVVGLDAPYVAEIARQYMVDRYGEDAYVAGYDVYTTVIGRNQQAAEKALRRGLMAYDQRHGYRGPVAHLDVSSETDVAMLDAALDSIPSSSELIPAVVISVGERNLSVYASTDEVIELDWSGLSWARKHIDNATVGPEPKVAADVAALGDIVYVHKTDDETWRLGQLPKVSGAIVSLNPSDGAMLAVSGGFDFYLSKFNRALQAQRQPGSNIKPFIYSAAMDHGFTPASMVSGAPIVVADASVDNVWRPENYSGKFFGPTRLRKALSLSLNLVSVRLVRAIGTSETVNHLTRFGFDREQLSDGLSLALGAASLTPLDVVTGYAVFANGGFLVEPYAVERVEDRDGRIVEQANPPRVCGTCITDFPVQAIVDNGVHSQQRRLARRVIDPENVFIMNSLMSDVIRFGTGRRAMDLGRHDLAGKTGTTNDFRDAWFSGFNSDVVTTVWVGFDHPTNMGRGEAGSKAALPIWIDFMRVALEGLAKKVRLAPDNVSTAWVDKDSGEPTASSNPNGYEEYFVVGNEPGTQTKRGGVVNATGSAEVSSDLF
ncbi:MAG: penicillin-binding protein 1A, partial [Gammaproteobacteria bacterium]|nr:penicillin-binding protein 1A [Gammaproteobacteria bacterium]